MLVSAAAGSGKTAVLVERIIRMVEDPVHPVDIDRLLVVTFTSAAAAQMRERISLALSRAVEEQPENAHLIRQLTLIHHAQITTIDSFCLYLVRNHFDEIGLDPDFRVADEGEIRLLKRDVLSDLLEERFAEEETESEEDEGRARGEGRNGSEGRKRDEGSEGRKFSGGGGIFFSPGKRQKAGRSSSFPLRILHGYPWPEEWLEEHKKDYDVSEGRPGCLPVDGGAEKPREAAAFPKPDSFWSRRSPSAGSRTALICIRILFWRILIRWRSCPSGKAFRRSSTAFRAFPSAGSAPKRTRPFPRKKGSGRRSFAAR